jgi:hypothetical protein
VAAPLEYNWTEAHSHKYQEKALEGDPAKISDTHFAF